MFVRRGRAGSTQIAYISVVSSGSDSGTVVRLFSRQSTMPLSQRHGCGHSLTAPHSIWAFSVRPAHGVGGWGGGVGHRMLIIALEQKVCRAHRMTMFEALETYKHVPVHWRSFIMGQTKSRARKPAQSVQSVLVIIKCCRRVRQHYNYSASQACAFCVMRSSVSGNGAPENTHHITQRACAFARINWFRHIGTLTRHTLFNEFPARTRARRETPSHASTCVLRLPASIIMRRNKHNSVSA